MTWVDPLVRDPELRDAYEGVEDLASWSAWEPFETAPGSAPREPGVYLFRERGTCLIRYAGMAGERAAGGRPQGLYGRLTAYRSGHETVSGFGEAALDLALADEAWLGQQLRDLRAGGPRRAKVWARDAVAWLAPEVSWAVRPDREDAKHLEEQVLLLLRPCGVWNR